jgi:hypothetical protein
MRMPLSLIGLLAGGIAMPSSRPDPPILRPEPPRYRGRYRNTKGGARCTECGVTLSRKECLNRMCKNFTERINA